MSDADYGDYPPLIPPADRGKKMTTAPDDKTIKTNRSLALTSGMHNMTVYPGLSAWDMYCMVPGTDDLVLVEVEYRIVRTVHQPGEKWEWDE